MSGPAILELVGYLGSVLVLVSFLMASVVKLRVVNSVGSLIFAVYALLIHSYPTAFMNVCLVLINLYYLRKLGNKENHYDLLRTDSQDNYLAYLLEYYRPDMEKCFPGLKVDQTRANRAYLICCDGAPAGIFLGREEDGELDILLDYSTPAYRDCSVGEYLFEKMPLDGIRRLLYAGPAKHHQDYLRKMGFQKEEGAYVKNLKEVEKNENPVL